MFQRDEKQKEKKTGGNERQPWGGFVLLSSSIEYKTATVFTKLTVNNRGHDA